MPGTQQARRGVPSSAVDPFADDFLRDPFPWHEELREAGPVVWLEQYGVWAMARYAEVHEALRDWQTFFRTTTRAVEVAGARIGAGEKVLLFLAAANRDPRRWEDPGRFDIRRRAVGHVGFGFGIHACVGAAFSRVEGEVLLAALARGVRALEHAGEPVRRLNNTLSGFASLPLRIRAAAT